jgi:hypothetical protein
METEGSSEILINIYQTTWHHIPEDSKNQTNYCYYEFSAVCFIIVYVYTIHGTDIPYVFPFLHVSA